MNIFLLGLRVKDEAIQEEGVSNLIAEALPSTDKKVLTKVSLKQKSDHYVGKVLASLKKDEVFLAIGPTKSDPDGLLKMQPMLVVSNNNWNDLLAINLFIATGGLGPKTDEAQLGDSTVTNRSLAWQDENQETNWMKVSCWNELSGQLAELPAGTPTIAVGRVSTSEKDDRIFLNYGVDKILYLPRSQKAAPKKAADPEKGLVSTAALGSLDFSL
jgi:hypothetical protein